MQGTVPTRQTRRNAIESSDDNDDDDNDNCSDGDDDNGCDAHTSDLGTDQDEDIIQAAEEAQEGDLDEAAQSAELAIMVTDGKQKVASTALSKASIIIYLGVTISADHTL